MRDGAGLYSVPAGTDGIPDHSIESTKYNAFVHDVENDLNLPRPVVAGGTGGSNATDARSALQAERAMQTVTNYSSHVWETGSFWSSTTATGGPVDGQSFTGIVLISNNDPNYITLEARDTDTVSEAYTRQKVAGTWGPWVKGISTSLPDGTAAAPGLPFSSDPDSGIYLIGEDNFGIATGGVGRVTVTNNGTGIDLPPGHTVGQSPASSGYPFIGGGLDVGGVLQLHPEQASFYAYGDFASTAYFANNTPTSWGYAIGNIGSNNFGILYTTHAFSITPPFDAQTKQSMVWAPSWTYIQNPQSASGVNPSFNGGIAVADGFNTAGAASIVSNTRGLGSINFVFSDWSGSAAKDLVFIRNAGITLQAVAPTATDVALAVKGAASQTQALQLWQNSAGTPLSTITKDGYLNINSINLFVGGPAGTATGLFGDGTNIGLRTYAGAGKIYFQNASAAVTFGDWDQTRLQSNTDIVCKSGNVINDAVAGGNTDYYLRNETLTLKGYLQWARADNSIRIGNATGSNEIQLSSAGVVQLALGYRGRGGNAGAYDTFTHNFFWTGSANQQWIDGTNTGTVNVTCDYRTKKDVAPLESTWAAVKALRPIVYTQREYTPPGSTRPLFVNDDTRRWGFIAHELQESLLTSAAHGTKDAPNEIQSPDLMAVVAALTRALQEVMERVETLEHWNSDK